MKGLSGLAIKASVVTLAVSIALVFIAKPYYPELVKQRRASSSSVLENGAESGEKQECRPSPRDIEMGAGSSQVVEDDVETLVKKAINENAVVIFSKSYCPYCKGAKSAIASAGKHVADFQKPKIFELDQMKNGSAIQAYLGRMTGRRTVPNVFIGGKSVGGGDDVVGYERSGVLKQMLTQAPEQLRAATAATKAKSKSGTADADMPETTKIAVFGAGCFWGVELAFQRTAGVVKTEVGYSNGNTARTTYEAVCTGRTNHAEVVKVWYEPEVVSYEELLQLWESRHDPTSKDKQGNDRGTQYRSAIFYFDDAQREAAMKWKEAAGSRHSKLIVTDISPISNYMPAEGYHQQYLEKKGQSAAKGTSAPIRCYG